MRFDTLDSHAPQPTMLTPGDVVIATAEFDVRDAETVRTLTSELGWRRGVLVFEHTTLADAAAEFNRYNREKLVIADTAAGRRTIGGTFPVERCRTVCTRGAGCFSDCAWKPKRTRS